MRNDLANEDVDELLNRIDGYCEQLGPGCECGLPTWKDECVIELRAIVRRWFDGLHDGNAR